MNYGWRGTLEELFSLGKENLIHSLVSFLQSHDLEVGQAQVEAWRDCYDFLSGIFSDKLTTFGTLILVFEYMLPLEKLKRPDVLILLEDRVLVLEFKRKVQAKINDIEQAIFYREGIRNFHHATFEYRLAVESYLVLTQADQGGQIYRGIKTLVATNFISALSLQATQSLTISRTDKWLSSHYQPIPSVIEATLTLFQEGELPQIKVLESGDIEQAVTLIKKRIYLNQVSLKKKEILFVSGVPGAGKTLVALKTLYDYNAYQYKHFSNPIASIYLSGNGPLVNVLQEQLQDIQYNDSVGQTYIRGVYAFKREYLHTPKIPPFHVIFFDEAQRAWDKQKMGRYQMSEPEALLAVGEKIYQDKGFVTIICFIGDGQFIHFGEEQGLALWQDALKKFQGWHVFIPPNYVHAFQQISTKTEVKLFLDTSIRSHFIDTSDWIEAVLCGDLEKSVGELRLMREKGFILRVSRDYEASKQFIEEFASNYVHFTYGLLVSSKAEERAVRKYTNNSAYSSFMKDTDAGKWFLNQSKFWSQGATEFVCQGLELDFPLVCFGGDYYINNGKWEIDPTIYARFQRRSASDFSPKRFANFPAIVENIYRVLLTRARSGMVLYIPAEPQFDETYSFFKAMED